jgi:hypothetical protein
MYACVFIYTHPHPHVHPHTHVHTGTPTDRYTHTSTLRRLAREQAFKNCMLQKRPILEANETY